MAMHLASCVLSLMLALCPTADLAGDIEETAVQQIGDEWTALQASIDAGELRESTFRIGGAQNMDEYVVHFAGGSDSDFEMTPYAQPFKVRRVVHTRTMPVVGPGKATYWYVESGELFFALLHGPDLADANLSLTAMDDIRAYYAGAEVVHILCDSPEHRGGQPELQLTGSDPSVARAAAITIRLRAGAVRDALTALATAA
ncbi:MAG: hypothetical protein ACJAZO_004853 [Myxococcota bacterium]|jgi:hypothetical protein